MPKEESLEERLKAGHEESRREKNIEVRKSLAQEWYERGLKKEDAKQKIACFELAIDFGLDNEDIFFNLSMAYYKKGQWDNAIKYLEKTIKANPKHVIAHSKLGVSHSYIKNYGKSLEYCKKAVELDPESTTAHDHLGIVYHQHEQYENAIKSFQDALDVKPDNAWAYFYLGNTYTAMKEFDKAMECYYKTIEIEPKFTAAQNCIDYLKEQRKK